MYRSLSHERGPWYPPHQEEGTFSLFFFFMNHTHHSISVLEIGCHGEFIENANKAKGLSI